MAFSSMSSKIEQHCRISSFWHASYSSYVFPIGQIKKCTPFLPIYASCICIFPSSFDLSNTLAISNTWSKISFLVSNLDASRSLMLPSKDRQSCRKRWLRSKKKDDVPYILVYDYIQVAHGHAKKHLLLQPKGQDILESHL